MKVVVASSNEGKIHELQTALASYAIELIPQANFGLETVEETGKTFIENALLKARATCEATQLPVLADDSGLVVPALNGAPGIYSARYAGEEVSFPQNIKKLLSELRSIPAGERQAFFYCALVVLKTADDPVPLIGEGIWHGEVAFEAKGSMGFGYDPIFYVPSEQKTAAELEPEYKNNISHRAIALQQLLKRWSIGFTNP